VGKDMLKEFFTGAVMTLKKDSMRTQVEIRKGILARSLRGCSAALQENFASAPGASGRRDCLESLGGQKKWLGLRGCRTTLPMCVN